MKTYNWGILGTGSIAHQMASAIPFVPNSALYAIASRDISTANTFASAFHIQQSYGSYEALVRDPAVDIVYVATPHNLHCENTLMALEHGKHVLCEKPFAVNGKEVRKMIAKAREKNLFLMEALWSRFLPNIIKARELVDSGLIGNVKLLKADFGLNRPFDPDNRLFNKQLIGGSLLDLGIYPLFLALLILGKPDRIKAMAGMGATAVDYNCSFTLGYKDDALAVLHSSLVAQTETVATIYGEKGTIVFDKNWYTPVHMHANLHDGQKIKTALTFEGNGYNYEATEVIECLKQRKTQSAIMSWEDSTLLIDTLDEIRKQIGLVYPDHD
jgi:predicted dehydrogenase